MPIPETLSVAEVADFINWLGEPYYFAETPDWLWDDALEMREGKYVAAVPSQMVNPRSIFFHATFCTNDDEVDPLKIGGEDVLPVFERWLADQVSAVVAFRIPKENMAEADAFLAALGAVRQ